MILLLLLFLSVNALSWRPSWMPPVWDKSCAFTRTDAMNCFAKYVDVEPRDGGITPNEIRLAINRYSTPPIRALFWGIGTKQTMAGCDADHNGVITAKDWVESAHKCLPSHENMCSVKWFCDRAEERFKKYGG
jgi:hypothetical protein